MLRTVLFASTAATAVASTCDASGQTSGQLFQFTGKTETTYGRFMSAAFCCEMCCKDGSYEAWNLAALGIPPTRSACICGEKAGPPHGARGISGKCAAAVVDAESTNNCSDALSVIGSTAPGMETAFANMVNEFEKKTDFHSDLKVHGDGMKIVYGAMEQISKTCPGLSDECQSDLKKFFTDYGDAYSPEYKKLQECEKDCDAPYSVWKDTCLTKMHPGLDTSLKVCGLVNGMVV